MWVACTSPHLVHSAAISLKYNTSHLSLSNSIFYIFIQNLLAGNGVFPLTCMDAAPGSPMGTDALQ